MMTPDEKAAAERITQTWQRRTPKCDSENENCGDVHEEHHI